MKSITADKDIGHPFSYNHHCAIFERDAKKSYRAFHGLKPTSQHGNPENDLRTKRIALTLFSYDGANQLIYFSSGFHIYFGIPLLSPKIPQAFLH